MRVDYGRRPTVRKPTRSMPASWKRVKWDGCTFYLPPGFSDPGSARVSNGQLIVTCPPMKKHAGATSGSSHNCDGYPELNNRQVAPPNLLRLNALNSDFAADNAYLPDPGPCGWYLFGSASVSRGGSIVLESNLWWKSVSKVTVGNRELGFTRLSANQIRLHVPSNWPHDYLIGSAGGQMALTIVGVGGKASSTTTLVTPTILRSHLIRVTGLASRR